MSSFIVCVPFYSLPEFPKVCYIVKNHNIALRDILLCNQTNTIHIEAGIQYDPHIETLEYRYCEPRVREMLFKKRNEYNELYILFRTRYLHLWGPSKYYVVGYYEIDKNIKEFEDGMPVIHAKKARFVALSDAIDVSKIIAMFKAFRACPTNENQKWKPFLERWLNQLKEKPDMISVYIDETNRLKDVYRRNEFTDTPFYRDCYGCNYKDMKGLICPLIWRRTYYGRLPNLPAHYSE